MDHAVTEGFYAGQDHPSVIVQDCVSRGIRGVVCHKGMMRLLSSVHLPPIFLQLFGATSVGASKALLLEPEGALTLDCVGIAAELNVDGDSSNLAVAFETVERSQRLGLLTLVMLSFKGESVAALARAITVASQVGPDFIKVRLPLDAEFNAEQEHVLTQAIQSAPPLLLAGGAQDGSLEFKVGAAKKLGFSGTCIGRSYFWKDERSKNLEIVTRTFTADC